MAAGADGASYTVEVAVDTGDGRSDVWSLRQMWQDNGRDFKLAFRHADQTEVLVPVGRS